MQFDAAAVPCALYAGIASVAGNFMIGDQGNWRGVTLEVSYQLLKGPACRSKPGVWLRMLEQGK